MIAPGCEMITGSGLFTHRMPMTSALDPSGLLSKFQCASGDCALAHSDKQCHKRSQPYMYTEQ